VSAQVKREAIQGLVFDIDTFAVHDGPGIRLAVYLKGCPLSCKWCHSPESQGSEPELVLTHDRCLLCGRCAVVCAQSAHVVEDGRHSIARERCVACGRCVAICPSRALAIKGYWISAGEVVEQAVRMKPFFDHSGGGITLSGGEVAAQAEFAAAVLAGCREQGIHTAIETSGATSWDRLRSLVELCDLVLYDIKLVDEAAHRKWVGASNQQILDNAISIGCSSRQGTHQEANTFRSVGSPWASAALLKPATGAPSSPFRPSSGGRVKSGTGLPMSAEGRRDGSPVWSA